MKLAILLLLASTAFAQELRRPTADADIGGTHFGCIGVDVGSTAMPKAYDAAGQSTFSTIQAQGNPGSFAFQTRRFSSWQTTKNTYTSLVLNVASSSRGYQSLGTGSGQAVIAYSTDSGATWTTIRNDTAGAGWTNRTDSVTLSTSQNLSQLQVAVCAEGSTQNRLTGEAGGDDIELYDIWTAGTTTPQGAGSGSSSGSPHRGMVIVN